MDVTRENFEEAMVKLEAVLESPQLRFVSFDEEMSGINFAGVGFHQFNDTSDRPCKRYAKMRRVASSFGLIQLGLTAWQESGEDLVASPFNIYVFPGSGDILLSGDAVGFLNKHGMSWSTWLEKGVPYVDEAGEANLSKSSDMVELTNADDAKFAQGELAKAASLRAGESVELAANPNPVVRRFIYQEIERLHQHLSTERRPGYKIFVKAMSKKDAREAAAAREKELALKIGARRVYKAVRSACRRGVPFVGHNCWFDLMFLMHHFDGPLPESYARWKQRCYDQLPNIIDTKILAQRRNCYGSLEQLYAAATDANPPSVRFATGFSKYEPEEGEDGVYHEAGFDSFATGFIYATMKLTTPEDAAPVENRVYNMRTVFDVRLGPLNDVDAFDDPLSWTPQSRLFLVTGASSSDQAREYFDDVHSHTFYKPNEWLVDARDRNRAALPAGCRVVDFAGHAKSLAKAEARRDASAESPVDQDGAVAHTTPWWDWLRAKFAALGRVSEGESPPRKRRRE